MTSACARIASARVAGATCFGSMPFRLSSHLAVNFVSPYFFTLGVLACLILHRSYAFSYSCRSSHVQWPCDTQSIQFHCGFLTDSWWLSCRKVLSDSHEDNQTSQIHKLFKSFFSLVYIKVDRLKSEPWHLYQVFWSHNHCLFLYSLWTKSGFFFPFF